MSSGGNVVCRTRVWGFLGIILLRGGFSSLTRKWRFPPRNATVPCTCWPWLGPVLSARFDPSFSSSWVSIFAKGSPCSHRNWCQVHPLTAAEAAVGCWRPPPGTGPLRKPSSVLEGEGGGDGFPVCVTLEVALMSQAERASSFLLICT